MRELSHIIPSFVFKHASVRSPSGFLRTTLAPNLREQDGLKEFLLCRDCEDRFARWERPFSNLFKTHYAQPGQNFDYSGSEALCALSIVWRVLAHARSHNELNHIVFGSDYSRTDEAYEKWRSVLLGRTANPGQFRIFWMFFDYVESGHSLGSDVNRYIFHSTDFDVIASNSESYVYAHLPGLFIVGALENFNRSDFRGFDVSFSGGKYISKEHKRAPNFLFHLIQQKNAIKLSASEELSDRQQSIIRHDVLSDPERAVGSYLFRTYLHDK